MGRTERILEPPKLSTKGARWYCLGVHEARATGSLCEGREELIEWIGLNSAEESLTHGSMSESTPAEGGQRKPSLNKNIKKLRAITTVCGLARSWQKWVCENEDKQSTEPSGWAPGEPAQRGEKKKPQPKETPAKHTNEEEKDDDYVGSIKTALVVKTVQSSAQERSAGVGMLAEKLGRDPSAGEEVDRLLSRKGSPTLRRMCGSISEITKALKETEGRKKNDMEDSGFSEADERSLESEGGAEDEVNIRKSSGPV